MSDHEDSVGLVVALSVNIVTYDMIGGDLWVTFNEENATLGPCGPTLVVTVALCIVHYEP